MGIGPNKAKERDLLLLVAPSGSARLTWEHRDALANRRGEGSMNDLAATFDAHVQAEFQDLDLEATMATMAADPYVHHVPTITGGNGAAGVRDFYGHHFIGQWPDDTETRQVSRTIGKDQVVDELMMTFTHDRELEIMLPGIPPTGRRIAVPVVVVVGFKDGKVSHEHIYWDQATVLVQAGLLDSSDLPVVGAEQADDRSEE